MRTRPKSSEAERCTAASFFETTSFTKSQLPMRVKPFFISSVSTADEVSELDVIGLPAFEKSTIAIEPPLAFMFVATR